MELYHALEWGNVRDIWYMLERGRAGDVYRLFGPALEDMLGIQVKQNGWILSGRRARSLRNVHCACIWPRGSIVV